MAHPKHEKIKATELERQILATREEAVRRATVALQELQAVSAEGFTLFCEARQIPVGAELVGITDEHVLVKLPEPAKAAK